MSVILFPLSHARRSAATDPRLGRLGIDEVDALTQLDFYACTGVHAEHGTLLIEPDDEARMLQYLEFHGMRLPRAVDAKQVLELCNDLRWSYGEAVRWAARGDADIATQFPGLSAEKLDYVRAVAGQERRAARDMARKLFGSRVGDVFLY